VEAKAVAEGCPWVFPKPSAGKPFVSVYYSWYTARTKTGPADVRVHDLRHSFASALVNRGMTLYDVQKLLGHSSIVTTQRYAHLAPGRLMQAASEAATHYALPALGSSPPAFKG
jgi:site-specific recombinase XerD